MVNAGIMVGGALGAPLPGRSGSGGVVFGPLELHQKAQSEGRVTIGAVDTVPPASAWSKGLLGHRIRRHWDNAAQGIRTGAPGSDC